MNIKAIPSLERPREKLSSYGVEQLSNSELMAIVIQTGSRQKSALQLAESIIHMYHDGIGGLNNTTIEELMKVSGVGLAKACQITAAVELGKRVNKTEIKILGEVCSPLKVANFFQSELKHNNKEQFIAVFLNTKNKITSYEVISVGSLSASIVHPREVFNRAIKKSAASIILVHNHPSGNPKPSNEDIKITERLTKVGEVVGIKILDHLIVSGENYYSFKEMDLI